MTMDKCEDLKVMKLALKTKTKKTSGKVGNIETSFDEGGNVLSPLEESHKSMNIETNRRSSLAFY
jgi:hypothetical protein